MKRTAEFVANQRSFFYSDKYFICLFSSKQIVTFVWFYGAVCEKQSKGDETRFYLRRCGSGHVSGRLFEFLIIRFNVKRFAMETNFELMKMLFEKHSREFSDRRAKIHATTEKYIALIIVLFTTINSRLIDITANVKILFAITTSIVMTVVIVVIYRDNKASLANAKIINKINNELGLWREGGLLSSLYDDKWKNFGYENCLKGILHHLIVLVVITSTLIISLFI